MKEFKRSVRLFEERGETSIFIDVGIDESGNVMMSGQDLGKVPQEYWGDSDYEYAILVNHGERDELLLALLQQMFSGSREAFSKFRDFLTKYNIKYEFDSWI
ncbi:MAG: hypothetical protein JW779_03595 [Candidatus Thorarchaeota archaeon]|nr:hypothetical protein [Candidatus Thorarchaeota archaeon]